MTSALNELVSMTTISLYLQVTRKAFGKGFWQIVTNCVATVATAIRLTVCQKVVSTSIIQSSTAIFIGSAFCRETVRPPARRCMGRLTMALLTAHKGWRSGRNDLPGRKFHDEQWERNFCANCKGRAGNYRRTGLVGVGRDRTVSAQPYRFRSRL
jgi:hypothetical protein